MALDAFASRPGISVGYLARPLDAWCPTIRAVSGGNAKMEALAVVAVG